jgi:hypothetical protein
MKFESLPSTTLSVLIIFLWRKITRSDVSKDYQQVLWLHTCAKFGPGWHQQTAIYIGNEKLIIQIGGKLNTTRNCPVTQTVPADTTIALVSNRHEITSADSHYKPTRLFYLTNIARHFRPLLQRAFGPPQSPLRLMRQATR